MKKVLAGMSAAAMMLAQSGTAFAAYSDVPAGVWYEEAVGAFLDAGYLDSTQARFRGSDTANRAEFVKLVVELNGGILSTPPAVASFDDVAPSAWFFGYFEESGKEGWVRGDGNCYGSHPCYARPSAQINRAEAAALIVRAFGLEWTGAAAQFVDNPSGQWYTDVIQTAADHCVLQGDDSTGRVRPSDSMNRAEMVVMLHRVDQGLAYGVNCGNVVLPAEPMIDNARAVDAQTVEVEFNMDLDMDAAEDISLYTISGTSDIDVDSAVMLDESTVELTLADALEAEGDYTLTVTDMMTAEGEEFSDSSDFTFSVIEQGDGELEVSLSSSNPVTDTVPKGAVGVTMLSLDVTASCDDSVVLEDMTILHEGFGDEADIDGVYAAIDGQRVSRKRTIDSEDQTAELRFSSPLVVDPCETVTVDVVVDFASDADTSAEHNLVVELSSDLVSNAKSVSGSFPLRGNTFRVAAVTSGTVTVDYRSITPNEVEVGDTGVVVGKFEVAVNSVEDQTFYSMTFEQNSSASDGDFTNIAIRRTDGTVLTNTVSQSVGDFVTVVFDPPFTVLEGDKITLEVIADIVGGAGDKVSMHFEETSDLFAVGSLYGYGINGQLYGSQVSIPNDDPTEVSIDAGEFTVGIDGPATQDYTRDDNDAVIAKVEFSTGGEKIDLKDFFIAIEAESQTGAYLGINGGASATAYTTANAMKVTEMLEDVELRNTVTGRTIDGVVLNTLSTDFGQGTTSNKGNYQIYRFDDFIVHGDEVWELRVDFIDNDVGNHPANGDQFKAHICGEPKQILANSSLTPNNTGCDFATLLSGGTNNVNKSYQMDIEGLSTGDTVGDVRPRGVISGNFHRIANANMTVAVKSLNTRDTTVKNAKDVNLLRFEVRAGEAEDILFTKSVFEAASGSLQNMKNYALWVDTDGDGDVDTILEDGVASQNNTVSFTDLAGGGFVVPAEDTILFEVHGDVASSLVNNGFQMRFATGSSVTFIEAEELDDGSNLSGLRVDGVLHGSATSADITVSTVPSTIWLLVNQGDLYVTQDSTPTRSRQLLGGALGEAVLRLQFHAENEDIDVTDLQLTNSGSTASSVDRLELYLDGATQPFALATVGGCGSDDVNTSGRTFCANMESRQLVIAEGTDVDVIVKPRMKSDTSGGTAGQFIRLFVDQTNVANESTGSGAVRARGDQSSNNLSANDEDGIAEGEIFIGRNTTTGVACTGAATGENCLILGGKNVSVLSKVTSIVNANPAPNNTGVPTGVTPFGQFKFTAAAHNNSNNGVNKVTLSGVIFNVTATNIEMDATQFFFYNKADSTIRSNCTDVRKSDGTPWVGSIASGSLLIGCEFLLRSAVNTQIDNGQESTFVLEGNVTNSQKQASAASTLQAALQNFDSISNGTFGYSSTSSHIDWLDRDSTDTQFFWIEYPETVVNSTTYKN